MASQVRYREFRFPVEIVWQGEGACLVTVSLDVPVQTTVHVGALVDSG